MDFDVHSGFAAALLVTGLALAGCSGNDADLGPTPTATDGPSGTGSPSTATAQPPPQTTPPTPGLLTTRLDDCRNFGAVFPLPMDAARAALPEGFEPVSSPSDPAGGATLYVLGLHCMGSSVSGEDTGAVDLAYAELAVVPPAELAVDGVDDYTLPLFFTASNEPVGAALATYRFGLAGAGDVGWAEHSGAGDLVVAATFSGVSVTLRGVYSTAPGAALSSGDFVLYGVQDGVVLTTILGSAEGGDAVDAVATLEHDGLSLLAEARPAARGFSVSGFSLAFEPMA